MLQFGPALRGWLRLLPWLLLLGGLAGSGWWRYYLAPRHVPYLWAGMLTLAGVLLASELDALLGRQARRRAALRRHAAAGDWPGGALPRPKPARPGDWLEAGVHWLPLLFLLSLGPTTLSLGRTPASGARPWQAAHQPVSSPGNSGNHYFLVPPQPAETPGPAASRTTPKSQPAPAAADNPAKADDAPVRKPESRHLSAPSLPAAEYLQTDLVKLFTRRNQPPDAPITVVGRLHRVKGDDIVLPEGIEPRQADLVLYRFAIWCCIADAVPVTAILKDVKRRELPDDAWVQLSGKLGYTGPEHDIPLIRVDRIEPIAEPEDPYLTIDPDELKADGSRSQP
jgi:hypothetical protein